MEANNKYTWHKIAASIHEINFAENGLTEVIINTKTICIARHQDELFACTQKCPHAGGIMAEGYIDAVGNIVCPVHRYKFNLDNGRNTSGEEYFLKTFPIEKRKEGVFVGIESNNLFGAMK